MALLSPDAVAPEKPLLALRQRDVITLAILLAAGGLVRFVLMTHPGYVFDLDYFFIPWAKQLQTVPFDRFYTGSGTDVDYPPLYLYVLWGLGKVAGWFSIDLNVDTTRHIIPPATNFLFKYPAVIGDLVLAIVVWSLARRRYRSAAPLFACGLILFNPPLIYNSAIWGQIDSLICLFAVAVIYLLATRRMILAAVVYALSITFKPHMLFMLPVFGTVYLMNSRYWEIVISIPAAAGAMLVALAPFAGSWNPVAVFVWFSDLLTRMEGKYTYLSMNMWNVWHSLGRVLPSEVASEDTHKIISGLPDSVARFVPNFHTLGLILIAIVCVMVAIMLIRRRDEANIWLGSAIMFLAVPMLGTRMHERYPLPAVILLVFAGIFYSPMRPLHYLLSLLHLINIHAVLSAFLVYLAAETQGFYYQPVHVLKEFSNSGITIAFSTVLMYGALLLMIAWMLHASFARDDDAQAGNKSFVIDGLLASIFIDLRGQGFRDRIRVMGAGMRKSLFGWLPSVPAVNQRGLDWFEALHSYFATPRRVAPRKVEPALDEHGEGPDAASPNILDKVASYIPDPLRLVKFPPFNWFARAFDETIPFHRFSRADLGLLSFLVVVASAIFLFNYTNPPYLYFDEEYFAKTAHQFARLEHLYPRVGFPWETTHPHLGKLFQASFIKLFGYEPWAYRLPNLIFAILSSLFMFLLARDVTRSRRMGFYAALFYILCGLSFSQARLCTIDSPAVFFMILSFFCFYKYFSGLWPAFPALSCTAVAIGMAIASKWTAVFGLGFLMTLMFWREFARVLAPVHSWSLWPKRMVCFWFSSRAFDMPRESEYLLDPANKPGETEATEETAQDEDPQEQEEPAESSDEPDSAAIVSAAVASDLPMGGEDFVQPKVPAWRFGVSLLMLVLFLVVIPLYIYAMSFMRLKQTDKNELKVNMYASTYESGKRKLIYKTIALLAKQDPNASNYTVMADEPFIGTIALAFERSRSMYDYHAGVGKEENYDPHPFESRWFHWPLLLRVIWYDSFSTSHKDYPTRMVRGVVAIGNPLLFWFGLPCILFLIWGAIEERRVGLLFVSVGFLFMYLPWVISPRQVTFLYHYLPAQPFMCIGVAYTMDDFWRDRRTRWLCALFVLGVVLIFFYFYPWLNDLPLTERGFTSRSWGGKWGVGY